VDRDEFLRTGYQCFPRDRLLDEWIDHCLPVARQAVGDPANRQWLRCGGTWFAGVNVLPNDRSGSLDQGPVLAGGAVQFASTLAGGPAVAWDRGQVSVCYPGYPQPMPEETQTAHLYRRNRDAAHVDGLLPQGRERRRYIREHHAFILGIPLTSAAKGSSPFVVWEGSHEIMRQALRQALAGRALGEWAGVDVTDAYQTARRTAFATCRRVEIATESGRAYVVHRLALHGLAPWADMVPAGPDGRMIVYFRPPIADPDLWLNGA
jgi:hypothetical protein